MISEHDARRQILTAISVLPPQEVSLEHSLDRFAAVELIATVPLPCFDNSAMDGYAVIGSSAHEGARLKIVGEQPAGTSRRFKISKDRAVRIFTGAPIPEGADAVVMQEDTERQGDFVVIKSGSPAPGEFVRKAGADLTIGQKILKIGQRLRPASLALAASQGITSLQVHRRARVALLTTGDEIVPPGSRLESGQIFESNGVMLASLVARAGGEVAMRRHCPDDFQTLCDSVGEAARLDALIISGGVSVGERDLVRKALEDLGGKIDLWRVSIKPGKPFLFGKLGDCAVFGLPGNPVSSFITFLVFVRPALLRMMGATDEELEAPQAVARVRGELEGDKERPHYVRGRLQGGFFAPIGRQESHALFGLASANALLRLTPRETLQDGAEAAVWMLE